ncbi:MAG: hypothetical protein NTX61_16755 [Bacteroidetes bacterium]|nr:hypothetical protein [Bacteroidota bacterium]
MKRALVLFCFCLSAICCSAQSLDTTNLLNLPGRYRPIPHHSLNLELLGQGLFFSGNYEEIFYHWGRFYFSGRAGIGYFPPPYTTYSVPLLGNCLLRVSNGFLFELGIGFSFTYTYWPDHYNGGPISDTNYFSGRIFDPLATCFIGFRVQGKKDFQFRFGFTPLIELTANRNRQMLNKHFPTSDLSILPWIGFSFGYSIR